MLNVLIICCVGIFMFLGGYLIGQMKVDIDLEEEVEIWKDRYSALLNKYGFVLYEQQNDKRFENIKRSYR